MVHFIIMSIKFVTLSIKYAFMPLVILCIVAIVNLLLLASLLLIKKPLAKSNKILAFIVLDPVLSMVFIIMAYYKTAANYPAIFYISYLYDFLSAPLFYYYILLVLHKETRFTAKKLLLFLSFSIGAVFFIWLGLQPWPYRHELLTRAQTGMYTWQFYALDYLTILQVAIYLPVCYTIVKKHNRLMEETFSNTSDISAQWLQEFVILSFFLCAVMYFPSVINTEPLLYMLVPAASLVLYCYLVYKAICSPLIFSEETLQIIEQAKTESVIEHDNILYTDTHELTNTLETLLNKKKLFLDPDLNIQTLAQECNTRVHILSSLINKHYSKNFFDYINSYRIQEAKKLFADPGQKKYSISTIAENSGFSSRSAFYNAFKKYTGATPGEYIKSIGNS